MKNYMVQAGTVFEEFEVIGDWTASGTSGALAVDNVNFTSGTGSLQVTSNGATSNYSATKTINQSFAQVGTCSVDVYIPDITNLNTVTIYLSSSTSFATYFSRIINANYMRKGWNTVLIGKNKWITSNGESFANTMVRMRVRLDTLGTGGSAANFDRFIINRYNRPKVIWTSDDGFETQYLVLFPAMRAVQLTGKHTCYLIATKIDTSTYLTTAETQTMYDAGCDMGNHTNTHPDMTSVTADQANSEVSLCNTYLIGRGFVRNLCNKHFAYPQGLYNDTTQQVMANNSMITVRSTIASTAATMPTPVDQPYVLKVQNLGNTVDLPTAIGYINNTVADGGSIILESHKFVPSPTTTLEFLDTSTIALANEIGRLHHSNIIDVVNLTEWYRGLTEPRKLV